MGIIVEARLPKAAWTDRYANDPAAFIVGWLTRKIGKAARRTQEIAGIVPHVKLEGISHSESLSH
jgi:hypothetical protein